MARTKKTTKAKEPVRIRFKQLANGNQSIYLDIYSSGKRSYEFLHLYIIPETDAAAKVQNANTLRAATQIKAQRVMDINNGKADVKDNGSKSKMFLLDWLDEYDREQTAKGRVTTMPISTLKEICEQYRGDKVIMRDIDKAYILGFMDYLRNHYVSAKTGKPLKQVTQHNYCVCLTCALNAAVRAEVIESNAFDKVAKVDRISAPESQRCYLTIDEVKRLIKTECKSDIVKRAFLFSVYCGLRISDVEALTWAQVTQDGEQWRVELTMKKTREPLYLPLNKQALLWMPDRGEARPTDKVFAGLPHKNYINRTLPQWVADAGITKHVSFHVARHTFATMMLTLGTDLYTTSKLLGHKEVTTTEIYAKIVSKKKDEAVNRADAINWD